MVFIFKTYNNTPFANFLAISTAMWIYTLLTTLFSSILGGYVATMVAKSSSLKNSLILGFAIILYNSISGISNTDVETYGLYPEWVVIVIYTGIIPAALAGGYLVEENLCPNCREDKLKHDKKNKTNE